MDLSNANKILSGLSKEQLAVLETAHWRHMCFAGVTSIDDASDQQAEVDRATYSHLLKYTKDGKPLVSGERTADFMAAVSGLPREWCIAWDESDFHTVHGVTTAEAVRLGKV